MAPHDSDSSGDEQEDYTETNVLLGYASKEPEDISRLGGRPVRFITSHAPEIYTDRLGAETDVTSKRNGSTPKSPHRLRSPGVGPAAT